MMSCDLVQPAGSFALLIQQRFQKPDDVHEQDMADFELSITFQLSGHVRAFRIHRKSFQFRTEPSRANAAPLTADRRAQLGKADA